MGAIVDGQPPQPQQIEEHLVTTAVGCNV